MSSNRFLLIVSVTWGTLVDSDQYMRRLGNLVMPIYCIIHNTDDTSATDILLIFLTPVSFARHKLYRFVSFVTKSSVFLSTKSR